MAGLMVRDLPENSYFSFAGIGNTQLMMNSIGIAAGNGVRVGLEDNIWYNASKTKLAANLDLLKRIHVIAAANERAIIKPAQLRKLLNLQEGNGKYGRNS